MDDRLRIEIHPANDRQSELAKELVDNLVTYQQAECPDWIYDIVIC